MRNILQPVVRLLASVPSVVYGLLGVLVLVPFIGNHLISESSKASVARVDLAERLQPAARRSLILTVMIAPLMVSIFCDGLRAVRASWLEGRWPRNQPLAHVLEDRGADRRPALVAGTVLATARALGEAVMLAMVSGWVGFAPNPLDGLIFFVEPSRPLAPTIITPRRPGSAPCRQTLFAIAAVLLFSAAMLSLAGWVGQAADEAVPAVRMSAVAPTPPRPPPPGRAPKSAAESTAAWRFPTGSGSRSAGRSGCCSARSPRRSSSTSWSRGSSTCGPSC